MLYICIGLRYSIYIELERKTMLVKESLPRQIYKLLKKEIILQENPTLRMGNKFNEAEIAKRFGCSVTPVRECMNMLRQSGLIVGESHQSSAVVSFTQKDVEDSFELRECLEIWALEKAFPNLTEEDVKAMQQVEKNYAMAYEAFNQEDIIRYNWDFHLIIINKANNGQFKKQIENLEDQISMMRAPIAKKRKSTNDHEYLMLPIREHDRILEAIAAHDLDEAKAALSDHLERIKMDCLKIYSE